MSMDARDQEITLSAGAMRLRVSPYGASLRGLWREVSGGAQEIMTAYTGFENKAGGQGDIMIPFPGRVREGRYTFGGHDHQLEPNCRESPAAIHGFLRFVPWDIVEQSDASITLQTEMGAGEYQGYPYALRATVTYTVTGTGMTGRFDIANTGDRQAPVAIGFHPYFSAGSVHIDADTLQVPMGSTLEFEGLLPTGRVLPVDGTAFDFRAPRQIGQTVLNTCFLNPVRDADGLVRVVLASPEAGRTVTVWMDDAFDFVVLYSGDPLPDSHRRRSLAIEPMTCGSDAFNYPEWGLVALDAGASFGGTWGVEAS